MGGEEASHHDVIARVPSATPASHPCSAIGGGVQVFACGL